MCDSNMLQLVPLSHASIKVWLCGAGPVGEYGLAQPERAAAGPEPGGLVWQPVPPRHPPQHALLHQLLHLHRPRRPHRRAAPPPGRAAQNPRRAARGRGRRSRRSRCAPRLPLPAALCLHSLVLHLRFLLSYQASLSGSREGQSLISGLSQGCCHWRFRALSSNCHLAKKCCWVGMQHVF